VSDDRDAGRVGLRMLDHANETLPRVRDHGVTVNLKNQKAPLERRRKERRRVNGES